jgi:sporulation protein YlmC with PRC-barrel domain
MTQSTHTVVKTENVIGRDVTNTAEENLGEIKEVMLDKQTGRVAYVVLESGTFLGMGGKLFALPWNSIKYNAESNSFILNIDKEKLKKAPGFDKDHWPDMADRQFGTTISNYYGTRPYWE